MTTGNGASVLRAGAGIARAIRPGGRMMMIIARRAEILGSGVATTMQERPALAFGLLSGLLGAVLAGWQVSAFPRRRTMWHRLRHGPGQFKAALDLPPLVIKLLANPLVQGYLRRRILREVLRKLGR
jgi:hypothetical protein